MKQAAYSDQDVQNMTKAFTDANPNVTVVPEFVSYDASTTRSSPTRSADRGSTTSC